jgi:hypothetical protein
MTYVIRIGLAATLAISGISHAYLYVHGYQYIPTIGPAFAAQAGTSFALAVLILVGGPGWLRWAAAAVAGGALVAFALSRTVGVFGFSERGWQPSPHAAISVAAELLTVGLWLAWVVMNSQPLLRRNNNVTLRRRLANPGANVKSSVR